MSTWGGTEDRSARVHVGGTEDRQRWPRAGKPRSLGARRDIWGGGRVSGVCHVLLWVLVAQTRAAAYPQTGRPLGALCRRHFDFKKKRKVPCDPRVSRAGSQTAETGAERKRRTRMSCSFTQKLSAARVGRTVRV